MYRSTNGRASLAEPEVWFRIIHVVVPARARAVHARAGGDGTKGAPVATPACAAEFRDAAGRYREQTVEIALGPEGAFENGNVGRLTRRVPADQVISAIPPPRGKPKPPKAPRTPRVVELPCPRRTK